MIDKEITAPDDSLIWDIWFTRFHLAAVSAAAELDLFTQLLPNGNTLDNLATSSGCKIDALQALLQVLVALKLIREESNVYYSTEISEAYLSRRGDMFWGAPLKEFGKRHEHKVLMRAMANEGVTLSHKGNAFSTMWEEGTVSTKAAEEFLDVMDSIIYPASVGVMLSGLFENCKSVLDVGGGSGRFAQIMRKKYPLMKISIFELPAVAQLLKEKNNFKDNKQTIDIIEGNFFKDDFPQGYDILYFSNIFHDWSPDKCRLLATKTYNALDVGGKVVLHEMLFDDDKKGPLATACFNLFMYLCFESQQFSGWEIIEILQDAGFKKIEINKTFGYYSTITGIK